jgi:hypothetical protein
VLHRVEWSWCCCCSSWWWSVIVVVVVVVIVIAAAAVVVVCIIHTSIGIINTSGGRNSINSSRGGIATTIPLDQQCQVLQGTQNEDLALVLDLVLDLVLVVVLIQSSC